MKYIAIFILALFCFGCTESITVPADPENISMSEIDFSITKVVNVESSSWNSIMQDEYWAANFWNLTDTRLLIRWRVKRYWTYANMVIDSAAFNIEGKIGLIAGLPSPPGKFRYHLFYEYKYLPAKNECYVEDGATSGSPGLAQGLAYVPSYTYHPDYEYPFTRINVEVQKNQALYKFQFHGRVYANQKLCLSDFAVTRCVQQVQ